ncbi:MAG TPA: DUF885 family protein, partial [Candidatus Eisenbacteria bacterium]
MPDRPTIRTLGLLMLGLLSFLPTAKAAPVDDLARLCDEYWEGYLRANPTAATAIGDRRFDDRLDDITPAGIAREQRRLESVLARARSLDDQALDSGGRLTRAALIEEVEGQIARASCGFEEWVIDPLGGPQVEFMNLADYTTIDSPQDAARYVRRCRLMGHYLDDHIANLKSGLAQGKTSSRDAVRKTVDQLDALTSRSIDEWAILAPSKAEHAKWSASDRTRFRGDLTAVVRDGVRPA